MRAVGWVQVAALGIAALLPGLASAAPTASFVAHRGTAGGNNPAPLYVHFDATATTSSIAGDNAFRDLLFEWDFGDPQSGNWATNGLPRNRAIGGMAGHVFERSGTYTVKLTVTDRAGGSNTTTRTIVVQNPDTFWAANTACVSSSGNFTGCPSGAAQVASGDFTASMQSRVAAGSRRILFRRGETFVANSCYGTPNQRTEALVSAFGTGAQPVIQIAPGNTDCAMRLNGSSVDTATSGGWRVVDLRVTSPGATNPAWGFKTSFVFDELLLYKMDIGPTGFGFNVGPDQSGLNTAHKFYAVVDTQLRGNTGTPVSNPGSCYFGGASHQFISGVTCGQANAWQMRIAYTHKAVISNNVIAERAGAFEAIKLHCSLGRLDAVPGVVCNNMVFSENVLAKERLTIASGGNDQGTIENSVFERNVMPFGMVTVNPNNMHRYNLLEGFLLGPRGNSAESAQPRGNVFEQNTCDGRANPVSCVSINPGAKFDGLVMRNNLAFRPGTSPIPFFANNSGGTGTVTQSSNVSTTANPFVSTNPNRLLRSDFALRPDALTLIDKGVAMRSRTLDLLGHLAPQGAAPEIGAVEMETGGTPVVDGPPAPPVLLSVDVQP